jgi:hypothetical protein
MQLLRIRIREPGFINFWTPWSGIRIRDRRESGINIPDHISELIENFGFKTLKVFVADPDPVPFWTGSGMEKSRSGINIPVP